MSKANESHRLKITERKRERKKIVTLRVTITAFID